MAISFFVFVGVESSASVASSALDVTLLDVEESTSTLDVTVLDVAMSICDSFAANAEG